MLDDTYTDNNIKKVSWKRRLIYVCLAEDIGFFATAVLEVRIDRVGQIQ